MGLYCNHMRQTPARKAARTGSNGSIGIVLIVALCLAAAAAAYLAATRNTGGSTGSSNTTNGTETTMEENTDTGRASALPVPELGISLPLEGGLAGMTYVADTVDNPDRSRSPVAYVMVGSFHRLFKDCDDNYEGSDGPAFAILTRNNGDMPPQAAAAGTARQFDGFWISTSYPEGLDCGTDDQALASRIDQAAQELQAQLKTSLAAASQL